MTKMKQENLHRMHTNRMDNFNNGHVVRRDGGGPSNLTRRDKLQSRLPVLKPPLPPNPGSFLF